MSTSSHVPSSRSAARMAAIISWGWVMSWMQSNVVTRSTDPSDGSGSCRGVVEVGVRQAQLGPAALGPLQGEVGDVVPVDLAGRVGLRDQADGDARPAADVGHRPSGLQPLDHAVQRRQADREQVVAVPRLEGPFDAGRALLAVAVVVVAEARAERLRHLLDRRHQPREARELAHPERRRGVVDHHRDGLRRQRQPLVLVDVEEPRRALVVGPLPHPALVQPGRRRPARRSTAAGPPHRARGRGRGGRRGGPSRS